jgi:hypothetical protein
MKLIILLSYLTINSCPNVTGVVFARHSALEIVIVAGLGRFIFESVEDV